MLEFRNESTVPNVIDQENAAIPPHFPDTSRPSVTEEFYKNYLSVLQQCMQSCDTLLPYLAGRGQDVRVIEQLKDYLRRLLGVKPAYSPQEQFNHLYALRKWLFYVPVVSLRSPNKDVVTLMVIAYYYAVALQMETLFPNVAQAFCSGMSETPLGEILGVLDRQLARDPQDESLRMQSTLLVFPRQALAAYQARKQERRNSEMSGSEPSFDGFREQLAYSIEGAGIGAQRSPGFAPMPPRPREVSRTSSAGSTMYLEVPTVPSDPPHPGQSEFGASSSSIGLPWSVEPEEMSYGGEMSTEMPGGFVHHPHPTPAPPGQALWT